MWVAIFRFGIIRCCLYSSAFSIKKIDSVYLDLTRWWRQWFINCATSNLSPALFIWLTTCSAADSTDLLPQNHPCRSSEAFKILDSVKFHDILSGKTLDRQKRLLRVILEGTLAGGFSKLARREVCTVTWHDSKPCFTNWLTVCLTIVRRFFLSDSPKKFKTKNSNPQDDSRPWVPSLPLGAACRIT